jgi:hypothetical protein
VSQMLDISQHSTHIQSHHSRFSVITHNLKNGLS